MTHLRATDFRTMDTGDGVYEVVGLINDYDLVLQLDPSSAPRRLMQEHLIGQHHQLQEKHTLPDSGSHPYKLRALPNHSLKVHIRWPHKIQSGYLLLLWER